MTVTFRPAKRINTPLILGLAGPTKSGKTLSAHRLAVGLAQGKPVAMINAEGAKGHQYSDRFEYLATDIEAPFRPAKYTDALNTALALDPRPGVVIIDSCSHMHDGPGGILEWHEEELDRLAGQDKKRRERSTWTAWIRPKAAENQFIYAMLAADCHLILCFRAKEKIKIIPGQQPIDLGWQPIAGERVAFETIFTLVLPPHSKGVPDIGASEMREPFDALVPSDRPLSEETGEALARWSTGNGTAKSSGKSAGQSRNGNQAPALTTELLDLGTDLGIRDQVAALVATHRADNAADPAVHVAWLEKQITRLTAGVAARKKKPDSDIPIPVGAEGDS